MVMEFAMTVSYMDIKHFIQHSLPSPSSVTPTDSLVWMVFCLE